MKYTAALDPAANRVSLAVLGDGKVLFSGTVPMRGREGAKMPVFVTESLGKLGLKLEDISAWSVGSGPGSFTALRMGAALVDGWIFRHPDRSARSVPSSYALAAPLEPAEGERIGCLYDGRNHEVIYCEVRREQGEFVTVTEPLILDAAKAVERLSGAAFRMAYFAEEGEAIRSIIPEGLNLVPVENPRPEVLALQKSQPFDNKLTDLDYIRPAVVSEPKGI